MVIIWGAVEGLGDGGSREGGGMERGRSSEGRKSGMVKGGAKYWKPRLLVANLFAPSHVMPFSWCILTPQRNGPCQARCQHSNSTQNNLHPHINCSTRLKRLFLIERETKG